MELINKVEVVKRILFDLLEFTSEVSLGGLGQ
jgi:hypothetical protein